ncbi:phytanoyl-CoA dioxygenase family protein [Pedobacter sp.]|uniref:phytanoyl-CoA dioxygenase family protein n=1 Tax=Pedobacter sp. TaxID=1411316 RepID=UPI003D7F831F
MKNAFSYLKPDLAVFDEMMSNYGWIIYKDAIDEFFIEKITSSLAQEYQLRREIQVKNGISADMNGTLHHLVDRHNFSIELLSKKICDLQIKHYLSGNYILNSFGAVINIKDEKPYVQNIHRDIRSFTGDYKLMIQMIFVLDDFTFDNGATHFLSGSHKCDNKPDQEYFFDSAARAIAKRGSVILFDSNLWHAAGKNQTNNHRRALTLAFTRPFYKQQLDYPRLLGYDFETALSEDLKQILGYKSRLPENLNEYYQPVEKRMYQPNQG